jgi:TolB-like protein/Tfp pilus assembly protein PilF
MKAERWRQVNDLFQSAAERAPEERSAFLDQACHGDEGLHREVESLIASYQRAENFIESPAFEVAPELLTNDERAGALVGESIGHYRIESLIGAGGMGEVYLARDELLGRKVALKFLPERLTTEATQLSRFKTEARTASALNHPNILTVYEIGTEGSRQFIATEFIEGPTLRASLEHGRMNLHDALGIAVQAASALAAAHEAGVVHRDIKPENIMLRPDGYVKVLDFGIAKLTEQRPASDNHDIGTTAALEMRQGPVIGTARYMSPEQARGQTTDARSDIWSLGVVLYEMVAGNPPFSGATPSDCVASILMTEPPPLSGVVPDVSVKLQGIVQKALRKNSEERYQTIKEMLADLRRLHDSSESIVSGRQRQRKVITLLAASVTVGLVVTSLFIYLRPTRTVTNPPVGNVPPVASVIPERSIAVLPFENLSEEKANAFLADGVHDDVLTKLAKIADLKVISRTSVMQYRGKQDSRQIGKALGVSHVLHGTVRRSNAKVHINAQLVDARTDTHVWAEEYDRDMSEVFAIETEVAQSIANQLRTRLSPREKLAMQERVTSDLVAFDLYTRAKELVLTASGRSTGRTDLLEAVNLLNQAVSRDPLFLQAYCQLASAHDHLHVLGFDHTPARLALAEAAIQAAFRLRPDAGEAHLARAENLYRGYRDYGGALAELEVARQSLPNDALVFQLMAFIQRRQGRWEEATRNMERAVELDPRNTYTLQQMAWQYLFVRRYAEVKPLLAGVLAIEPNRVDTKVFLASVDFHSKADITPFRQTIDSIRTTNPSALPAIADAWLTCALAQRDPEAAASAMVAVGEDAFGDDTVQFNRTFVEGLVARMMKNEGKARTAFTAARTEQEKIVRAQPNYGPPLCVLGLIDAALGRKADALREGRRAVELLPVEQDAINGARMIKYLAMIAAWSGDKELACEKLAAVVRYPTSPSYGELKLLPFWDALRGDPCFEQIVDDSIFRPLHTRPAAATSVSTPAISAKSIAVLPFENLSRDGDNTYFADGIQEEILSRLSKIGDLKVISRTSTQRFKSAPQNLPEIAKELGVANILEGTVQKVGGQVRVNVQLIDARNDSHLWAEKYDRKLTDVFGVESEIAKAIADTLHAKLSGSEQRAIATRPTENPEAHQLYLKGTYFSNKRTAADLRTAIDYFKDAIGKDPNYALAYAGLADAYTILSVLGGEGPTMTVSKAKAAAIKALQLDDTLPEAHNSLGLVLAFYEFDFAQSKKEFERAIELNPNYADAHHQLGNVNLVKVGEFDRAIAEGTRALELDPLSLIINADLGQNYLMARRYEEAIEQNRKTLALDPRFYCAHWNLGEAFQMKGQLREAIAEYEKTVELTEDPTALAMLAQGYAMIGETDKARNLLAQLEQMAAHRYVGPVSFAFVHLALGEKEKALAQVEQACAQPADPDIINLKIEPLLDPLRGDPRFERLVEKVVGNVENTLPTH